MLHVDAITVSAFRGVPGEVTLNLTAPLTLLYAPNGTGKTTVCDAIEWTLTGAIERIAGMPSQLFRCQHALADRKTLVRAALSENTRQMQVCRSLDDDKVGVTSPGHAERRLPPSAFFECIVPSIATDFADARARLSRRRSWIVGTHFLSSERLARLMDSDDANRERRAELFADLLGVGQLQRLVPRFEKIVLAADKRLEELGATAALIRSRLSELQNQLSRTGAVVDLAPALTAIIDAARALAIPFPTELGESPDTLQAGVLRELAATVDSAKTAANQQIPSWRTLLEWIGHEEQIKGTPTASAKTIAELVREAAAAGEQVVVHRQNAANLAISKKDLTGRLSRLIPEISELRSARVSLERFAVGAGGQGMSLAQLVNAVQSIELSAIADRTMAARQLKGALSEALVRDSRLREAKILLAKMPEEQELSALHDTAAENLRRSREHEASLQRQWEALASLGQQIAELGREYVGTHAHSGHCPLCAHDWRTIESLRAAIASASDRLAPEMRSIQDAYASSRAATTESERKMLLAQSNIESQRTAVASVRLLEQQLQEFWGVCERLGLSTRQAPTVAAIDAVISAFATHEAALKATYTIGEILSDLATAPNALVWSEALANAVSLREAVREELETARRTLDEQTTSLASTITANETAHAILKERLGAAERALAETKGMLARRDAAAQAVGLDKQLTRPLVEQAHAAWERRREQLARLESLIQSASGTLLAQTWRAQVGLHETQATAAHKSVQAASKRCDDLRSLQNLLRTGLEAAKKSRVDGLRGGVEALFLKMHAARIAEGVTSTADSGGFAVRIGVWMSDAEYLSQGQRQDLAIAIFLARARAYGGTFFLDEPLLHLDDLNRVALLDVLRAVAIQEGGRVRLVVTTASSIVLRHLQQKCKGIVLEDGTPVLRAYDLSGTVKDGVHVRELKAE